MNQESSDFPDALLRELGQHRTPCPAGEELLAYVEGNLPPERASGVSEHLELCGICDLASQRLRDGDVAMTDQELAESKRRLSAALAPLLSHTPGKAPARRGGRIGALLLHPGFAYSIAAALALVAFLWPRSVERRDRNVTSPVAVAAVIRALDPAQRIELDLTRSEREVHVLSGPGDLVLSFVLPMRPGTEYTATLYRGEGDAVGPAQNLAVSSDGYFYVVVSRSVAGHGLLRLVVSERTQGAGRQFVFPFTID